MKNERKMRLRCVDAKAIITLMQTHPKFAGGKNCEKNMQITTRDIFTSETQTLNKIANVNEVCEWVRAHARLFMCVCVRACF